MKVSKGTIIKHDMNELTKCPWRCVLVISGDRINNNAHMI